MKMKRKFVYASLFAACLFSTSVSLSAQDANTMDDASKSEGDMISASMEGNIFKPALVEATDQRVKALKVPAGFTVTKFAENLGKPRMIAVSNKGHVYVTNRDEGTVTLLTDTNNDGKADGNKVVAKRDQMHGITIHKNKMYLITVEDVFTTDFKDDGTLGELTMIMKGLPDGGQHANRTIAVGPDNMLYVSVGSTCNACEETSKESATMIQAKLDGTDRKVYAKGLRNTIGFDWHPQTKELYGMDHGIDWLGDESQREELNKIEKDGNYGWPYVYENGKPNLADTPPQGQTFEEYAKKTKSPLLTYEAHSAPMGMKFYTGTQFPAEYKNSAFVALRGSWNRAEPAGYKVVRIKFENGKPAAFEDFLSGFLVENNKSQFGRVVGVAQHTDGSLLVTDDNNGVVYRVAYKQ
jgi:glucose/arabinose dehydrogenase